MELCQQAGFNVEDMSLEPPGASRVSRYWRALPWLWPGSHPVSHLHYGPGLIGTYDQAIHSTLTSFTGTRIILWERTFDRILPAIARKLGYRVIALPHNLETLCPEKPADLHAVATDFHGEVSRLGEAEARFMIAREEQWLLANLGLEAGYLPYFPPTPVATQLRRIRTYRQEHPPHRVILILGNALHPPTAEGMRAAIHDSVSVLPEGWQIHVAGFGSEVLRREFASPTIEFRGAVSMPALEALLKGASVLVVNQTRGAGALTRIPEALMAGIPVLANPIAARSAEEYPGLYVYRRRAHLRELLQCDLPLPPEPGFPKPACDHFLSVLKRFANVDPVSAGPR